MFFTYTIIVEIHILKNHESMKGNRIYKKWKLWKKWKECVIESNDCTLGSPIFF